ncbi:hypothetical protein PAXRUDRAFT_20222 [Paxillus rubicundulus Ve08.2h10]|uniref:Uncharacterized protein n=1 Tax=Paxillus rubicundulus Ve08.2h10 TaxID=930991 RepID=A0A0D0BRG8_9AGAM|nr:hypothetical protein PAXRUDRAFT_20222 [Paxillus rubicundulus Ve08.2h10]
MVGYTSPTKKACICHDKAAVKRIFNWYAKSEHYYEIKQKTGRPHFFTKHYTCCAVHTLAMGQVCDVTDLQQKHFLHIDPKTI